MFLVSKLSKVLTFVTVAGGGTAVGILCRPLIDKGYCKEPFNPKNPFETLDLTKLKFSRPVNGTNIVYIERKEEPEIINVAYEVIKSLPINFG